MKTLSLIKIIKQMILKCNRILKNSKIKLMKVIIKIKDKISNLKICNISEEEAANE